MNRAETIAQRFWNYVQHRGIGCWIWTGTTNELGYGRFKYNGAFTTAHRVAWILTHGEIEPALEVDHLCRNPVCVNPSHLEAVTVSENALRGRNSFNFNGKCRAGLHDVTRPSAIYVRPDGRRACRECINAYGRKRRRAGAA